MLRCQAKLSQFINQTDEQSFQTPWGLALVTFPIKPPVCFHDSGRGSGGKLHGHLDWGEVTVLPPLPERLQPKLEVAEPESLSPVTLPRHHKWLERRD